MKIMCCVCGGVCSRKPVQKAHTFLGVEGEITSRLSLGSSFIKLLDLSFLKELESCFKELLEMISCFLS